MGTETTPRVYVAAPFQDARSVFEVHESLRELRLEPSSSWVALALVVGAEDFSRFTPERLRELAETNDLDVASSKAMLVLAREGVGGEMFAEARLALMMGIPVVWLGRRTLSAWRLGVVRAESLDEALALVSKLVVEGYPGCR